MTMRLARCALVSLALAGLVACGGGGGDKETPTPAPETMPDPAPETMPDPTPDPTPDPMPEPMPEIKIMPQAPADEPGTIADAVAITGADPVSGNLSSPTDVDMFRLALDGPSTVAFWTTGEAETVVTPVDEDGSNLSATTDAAGRVSVTTSLDDVYARVTGREGGRAGNYNLHHSAEENGSAGGAGNLDCVSVTFRSAREYCDRGHYLYRPIFTNSCSYRVKVRYQWDRTARTGIEGAWRGFSGAIDPIPAEGTSESFQYGPVRARCLPNRPAFRYCQHRPKEDFPQESPGGVDACYLGDASVGGRAGIGIKWEYDPPESRPTG